MTHAKCYLKSPWNFCLELFPVIFSSHVTWGILWHSESCVSCLKLFQTNMSCFDISKSKRSLEPFLCLAWAIRINTKIRWNMDINCVKKEDKKECVRMRWSFIKSQGKGERRLNSTIKAGVRMDAKTSAVEADSFIYPPHKPLPKKPKHQIAKE